MKEQYLQEKKKISLEWEERLRSALSERSALTQEND